jgi:UDP-N-acetylglucosamine--N-acetylmuramyl-(pentapeptide) pyrophosphoryl-undecaprenol N-acetylglucosamine transferase
VKVLIAGGGTGGHLMPALALGAELAARRKDVEPVYVGATRGLEATVLPARGVRYHLLPAEPIYRRQWWNNVRLPLVAWRVLHECRRIVHDERPVLAIGTGGYAAGPVLAVARWQNVPLVLQEQNAYPGLTTRWLAGSARQIHLGFPEAARRLSPGVTTEVFTLGNPIVPPSAAPSAAQARSRLGIAGDARVVLFMGGSQGALGPNRAVAGIVDGGLLPGVVMLWSTGQAHWERCRQYDKPPTRQVRAFWDPIADAYAAADLVVARSGAMTLAEICAFGLPSILMPLPTAAADHQTANAQALEASGAAVLLPESRLSAESLSQSVRSLLADPARLTRMRDAARRRATPDATRDIVTRILPLLPPA